MPIANGTSVIVSSVSEDMQCITDDVGCTSFHILGLPESVWVEVR